MENTRKAQEYSLARYLKAAARQRYLMEPWHDDKRFVADGGTVFYAVDNDVLKLYTNPFGMAVSTPRRKEGYAEIFPDDEKPVSIALGRILADFVFLSLTDENKPLLVIPPLEQEIQSVFNSVKHNAEAEQRVAFRELEKVRALASKLKALATPELIAEEMLSIAPTMGRFLAGESGHSAEYRRFLRLLAEKRLMPLDLALASDYFQDEAIRHAMQPPMDFADRVTMHDLRENWFNRLLTKKSRSVDLLYVYDDAQVLARLEWINQRLSGRARLVLITGDHAMFEAADYMPEGEGGTFAERYLRHPKCYLAEPWVLSPEKTAELGRSKDVTTEFFDWLETFLSNLRLQDGESYSQFLRMVSESSEAEVESLLLCGRDDRDDIMRDFQEHWRDYVRSVMLDHGIPPSSEYQNKRAALQIWEKLQKSFEVAAGLLENKVQESWEDLFEISTAKGYEMVFLRQTGRAGAQPMRARNSPMLDFDRLSKAKAFIQNILASYETGHLEDYRAEIEKLRDEDKTGYTYYLAFGVLFATEGVWGVAAIMADRAKNIVKEKSDARITGREASYLLAVTLRHISDNAKELHGFQHLLTEADECLRLDKQAYPPLNVSSMRFDAEHMAFQLTYRLFHRFLGDELPEDVWSLNKIEVGICDLLAQLDRERKPEIRHVVERNLLTNLFMTTFLRHENLSAATVEERNTIKPYFSRFDANLINNETSILITYLVKVVHLLAKWWLTEEKPQRKTLGNELIGLLSNDNIQANKVMPYDIERFGYLRSLVEPLRRSKI